jgi:hypothetical protein
MAKKVYVGVDDMARKAGKEYIGVNGIARKIKSGHVGVNEIARKFLSDIPNFTISYTGDFTDEIVTSDGKTYRLLTLTSSGTLTASTQFTADVFLVGGGGAGGAAVGRSYNIADAAQGGAGGYIETQYNIALGGSNDCVVTIGAGGESVEANGTSSSTGSSTYQKGGSGGSTKCIVNSATYTASGGGGGSAQACNSSGIASQNANGGGYGGRGYSISSEDNEGVVNMVNSGFRFDETSGTHYGTGGSGVYRQNSDDGNNKLYAGNSVFGGGGGGLSTGSSTRKFAEAGKTYGSGGGGAVNVAGSSSRRYAVSGAGMQGVVMIRIR